MIYFELSVWASIGLIAGSFVNVCTDRLPLQFSNKEKRLSLMKSPETPSYIKKHILDLSINIFQPARSFCFSCGLKLSWFDIVPLFSYFFYKGQCRKCNYSFGSKTIWTESIHCLFYLLSGWFFDGYLNPLALSLIFSIIWIMVHFFTFSTSSQIHFYT